MIKNKKDISIKEFLIYAGVTVFIVIIIFTAVFVFKFDITKFAERLEPMPSP